MARVSQSGRGGWERQQSICIHDAFAQSSASWNLISCSPLNIQGEEGLTAVFHLIGSILGLQRPPRWSLGSDSCPSLSLCLALCPLWGGPQVLAHPGFSQALPGSAHGSILGLVTSPPPYAGSLAPSLCSVFSGESVPR